jgi:hypothetical protein
MRNIILTAAAAAALIVATVPSFAAPSKEESGTQTTSFANGNHQNGDWYLFGAKHR